MTKLRLHPLKTEWKKNSNKKIVEHMLDWCRNIFSRTNATHVVFAFGSTVHDATGNKWHLMCKMLSQQSGDDSKQRVSSVPENLLLVSDLAVLIITHGWTTNVTFSICKCTSIEFSHARRSATRTRGGRKGSQRHAGSNTHPSLLTPPHPSSLPPSHRQHQKNIVHVWKTSEIQTANRTKTDTHSLFLGSFVATEIPKNASQNKTKWYAFFLKCNIIQNLNAGPLFALNTWM